eukprot:COSAG06_NODE_6862_length_2740_cov_1159.820901_3_plen_92_part_00
MTSREPAAELALTGGIRPYAPRQPPLQMEAAAYPPIGAPREAVAGSLPLNRNRSITAERADQTLPPTRAGTRLPRRRHARDRPVFRPRQRP